MSLYVGVGGVTRNGCAAVCTRDAVLGVCEQERVTRVRASGFGASGLPDEALREILRGTGRTIDEVACYAAGEPLPATLGAPLVALDHHFAHACSAFLASPFDDATIVVCDHEAPEVSVWNGEGGAVARAEGPWDGPGFASVYSGCAEAFGFSQGANEQRFEALARLRPTQPGERAASFMDLDGDRLALASDWQSKVREWRTARAAGADVAHDAAIAAALQSRLGDLLLRFLGGVKRRAGAQTRLCVGGSLFSNSGLNTRIKASGLFDEVFVPINPGNAGLAVGTALHASGGPRRPVTPFLGPSYSAEDIKSVLDNCKLQYSWMSEGAVVAAAVEALKRGRLVGWFDGPMEWGPRALGCRSILANPFAPYVLENLNRFLKHRDWWRGYALSGLHGAVSAHFDGPDASPFMECDYTPKDPEALRHFLPAPDAAIRVHTAGADAPPRFVALLRAFEQSSGAALLVNTSFNGFAEPIVCSPRDAVRVFFGTGLDLLVLGQFVLSK